MITNVRKVLRAALRTLYRNRERLEAQITQIEAALGQPKGRPMKATTRKILSTKMKERWAAVNQQPQLPSRRKKKVVNG